MFCVFRLACCRFEADVNTYSGAHICFAGVYYYDSMGGNNNNCLRALLKYLEDEHLDKKKSPLDPPASQWDAQLVKDIPQQMNGSDCGMFTCKFAEYVTRRADINFTQEHMPYFRRRMIYEILTLQLM